MLGDLTPREMERLLLCLAEGEAPEEQSDGTFDFGKFAAMKGE